MQSLLIKAISITTISLGLVSLSLDQLPPATVELKRFPQITLEQLPPDARPLG